MNRDMEVIAYLHVVPDRRSHSGTVHTVRADRVTTRTKHCTEGCSPGCVAIKILLTVPHELFNPRSSTAKAAVAGWDGDLPRIDSADPSPPAAPLHEQDDTEDPS